MKKLICTLTFILLANPLLKGNGDVDGLNIIIISSFKEYIISYERPKLESVIISKTKIAESKIYRLLSIDGSDKAIVFEISKSDNYNEVYKITNQFSLRRLNQEHWEIDDKSPAEAPLGGLAVREIYLAIFHDLNMQKNYSACTWEHLIAFDLEANPGTRDNTN